MYGRGYQTVSFGPPVTPNVIKQLLILNVGVCVLQQLVPQVAVVLESGRAIPCDWLTAWFAVWPDRVWTTGTFWQPFSYMFLHADLMHLAFNMLALWMFGSPVASVWGERRFLRFYLTCGFGAGLIIASWPGLLVLFGMGEPAGWSLPTLGASGAVFGVLLAYSLTWPDRTIMLLFPPIPIKAIYFIPFILGFGIFFGPANVSHIGHLGGVIVGWILFRRIKQAPILPSMEQIRYRYRRYRMRRNLKAVRMDEHSRWRDRPDDDRRVH